MRVRQAKPNNGSICSRRGGETSFFSDRQRAALAWAEAVTRISEHHIDNTLYAELQRHLSEREIASLTLAVAAVNDWNRLAIPFQTPAGSYRPPPSTVQESPASLNMRL
jgi:alkylhydroperoxidase family enzyme